MILQIKKILLEDGLTNIPPLKLDTQKLKIDTPEQALKFTRRATNQAANAINKNISNKTLIGASTGAGIGAGTGALLFDAIGGDTQDNIESVNSVLPDGTQLNNTEPALVGAGLGGLSGALYGAGMGREMAAGQISGMANSRTNNIVDRLDKHGIQPTNPVMDQLNKLKIRRVILGKSLRGRI